MRGSRHPLLINQFGTERRMCLALGVDRLDDVAAKLADVLELTPPQGIADKLRALGKLKSLADSSPKTVSRGPCQEIVLDPPDLDRLPIMTCWPSDGGPFITLPSVITKDPKTGGRNVGMYRLHKYDARTTGLHWQIHKDARRGLARGRGRMEVAIALGTDPITAYSGSAPLPKHVDELMLAGFLRGRAGRAGAVQDRRPAGARAGRDRDRGLLRARRARAPRARSATTPATTRRRSRSRCCT